jgi:hypothetical protein
MERLTMHDKRDYENILYSPNDEIEIVKRLAEYEDTGLTSEEIKAHEEMFTAYRHICGGRSPKEVARALKLLNVEKEGFPNITIKATIKSMKRDCGNKEKEEINKIKNGIREATGELGERMNEYEQEYKKMVEILEELKPLAKEKGL